jgi:subtilase-type serine protease
MTRTKHRLALHVALILSGGFTAQAHAIEVQIDTPTSVGQVLGNGDGLNISASGSVLVSGTAVSLDTDHVIPHLYVDNAGVIGSTTGRAIDTIGTQNSRGDFVITNRSGAMIYGVDDAVRIGNNFDYGTIDLDNSGTIRSLNGTGLNLDAIQSANFHTIIDNQKGGLIRGEAGDGIKSGANAFITNYGEISSGDSRTAGETFDGVDAGSAAGVTLTNFGLITGGRYGVNTGQGALLDNFGTLTGRNGAGYYSSGDGVVYNNGDSNSDYKNPTIIGSVNGLQPNGDGDGIHIEHVATINNWRGTILGTGASGVDNNGVTNTSEGISMGGGYVLNSQYALISGANNGMLVSTGSGGPGVGATYLNNFGTIRGLNGFGVKFVGEFADQVFNNGLISGSNGLALDLGGGNDTLTLYTGSQFVGVVNGGSGHNTLIMDDLTAGYFPQNGSFGSSQNFESLQVRYGIWTLTGSGDFSVGGTVSNNAELINQGGITGTMTIDQHATYAGGGTVGNLNVNGTLLANTTLGAARVSGNLNMGSGSTLSFGANADGSSAAVKVGGNVNLNGASLLVRGSQDFRAYPSRSRYTVLEAGSISGQFDTVRSDYAFLIPTLNYDPTRIELTYTRNDRAFENYATTANGSRVAKTLETLDPNTLLHDALLNTSASTAGPAIEQLAGSSNANLSSATLSGASQVGTSMLAAMQQMGGNGGLLVGLDSTQTPALAATGVPPSARNLNDPNAQGRVWLQGIGSYGKLDGEHGSDGLTQRTAGSVLGVDWSLSPTWRVGVLGGYSKTNLDSSGVDGQIHSWHVGAYAMRQNGPLALRLGAAYSGHDGESKRSIDFNGFSDRPKGDYYADSQQAFAELGYALGSGRLNVEPFANLGYQRYHRDSYTEKGGEAALQVDSQTQDNVSSTFGVRLAHLSQLENGISLTPRASLGWRHTYGDVDSTTRQAFVLGGSAFSVEGTALDRDSLMTEAGLDIGLSARHTLSIGYSGELGSNSRNHALVGQWQMSF